MAFPASLIEENLEKAVRSPLKLSGTALVVLSFQTLGIIYSDLGTSPLYTLNGIWSANGPVPPEEDVIGGISAIIWALTLVPLIKYVIISLHFGTSEGEGGTFALYNGLFPPPETDEDDWTPISGSGASKSSSSSSGQGILRRGKWPILLWALFGTALTLSDGIFTPAVSVISAVAGLAIAKPSISDHLIPISIGFLIVLFLVQQLGTTKLTVFFAPVTFVWLALLAASGIINITHHPAIFRAVDPSRAVMWFVRTKNYDYLAGVILALTGSEAIFANLGQFNALSIQLCFSLFVYPCLVLAYLGQGARLIVDGETVMANIFFQTIPGPHNGALYWITFVVSILATLIASQALITATFSLVQQLINMKSLPPLRMSYTSDAIQGQVYVPFANWVLALATIIIVAVFKNLTNLTNAYGFAVATVMFVTTCLLAVQIVAVKNLSIFIALPFFLFFGFVDGLFWGASLKKVPAGAWVPLMIGAVLTILMFFWTWARGLEDEFDGSNRKNLRHFIVRSKRFLDEEPSPDSLAQSPTADISEHTGTVTSRLDRDGLVFVEDGGSKLTPLARTPTCAVFHKLTVGKGVPHSFYAFIKQMPALPRVVIFLSVRVVPIAHVDPKDKYVLSKVRSIPGFYGAFYCLGFRDKFKPDTQEMLRLASALEASANPHHIQRIIQELQDASRQACHIIPHYDVTSRYVKTKRMSTAVNWTRTLLIEGAYKRLSTMFPETANWKLNSEDILHVGVNASI